MSRYSSTICWRAARTMCALLAVNLLLIGLLTGRSYASDMDTLRDQGIHYFRQRLFVPAVDSLEKARALPGGEDDFRVQFFLARAYYEDFIIDKALERAGRAVEVAPTDEDRAEAETFLYGLEDFFGAVKFIPLPNEEGELVEEGYIYLTEDGGLINVQKKEAFDRLQLRYAQEGVKLPAVIHLPSGTNYEANGVEFELMEGDDMVEVEISLHPKEPVKMSPWYFVGGGAAAVAVTTTVVMLVLGDDGAGEGASDTQVIQVEDIRFNKSSTRPMAR